jgi:transposase
MFLTLVPDRGAATLLGKIKEHIEEGSVIYSDCWRGYNSDELIAAGFKHYKVNHKYNFVDPETGAHTQGIERVCWSAKWRNKKYRGSARHHLESYLGEFMWRKHVGEENVFESLLKDIVDFWPPAI